MGQPFHQGSIAVSRRRQRERWEEGLGDGWEDAQPQLRLHCRGLEAHLAENREACVSELCLAEHRLRVAEGELATQSAAQARARAESLRASESRVRELEEECLQQGRRASAQQTRAADFERLFEERGARLATVEAQLRAAEQRERELTAEVRCQSAQIARLDDAGAALQAAQEEAVAMEAALHERSQEDARQRELRRSLAQENEEARTRWRQACATVDDLRSRLAEDGQCKSELRDHVGSLKAELEAERAESLRQDATIAGLREELLEEQARAAEARAAEEGAMVRREEQGEHWQALSEALELSERRWLAQERSLGELRSLDAHLVEERARAEAESAARAQELASQLSSLQEAIAAEARPEAQELRGLSVQHICALAASRASLRVEALVAETPPLGDGAATHALSCPPDAALGVIADALEEYCKDAALSPRRTYVWICGSAERHREEGRHIGRVLALVSSWERPPVLQLAELAELALACGLAVTLIAPPAESRRLAREALRGSVGLVSRGWAALEALRRERPEVSVVDAHEVRIWLATAFEAAVRGLLASGELRGHPGARVCDALGWLLREVALKQRAAAMLQDGLLLTLGLHSGSLEAALFASVGTASGAARHDARLSALEEQRREQERAGTLETPGGLAVLGSLARARWAAGDRRAALEALLEARRARVATRSLETREGLLLLRNLGVVRAALGDGEAALAAYAEGEELLRLVGDGCGAVASLLRLERGLLLAFRGEDAAETLREALRLLEALCGESLETPSRATLLATLGVALGARDPAAAARAYNSARRVREGTEGLGSAAGVALLRNIGVASVARGDAARAFEAYGEALRLRRQMGIAQTAMGASLLLSIGMARAWRGHRAAALEALREAKDLYRRLGVLQTPDGKKLLEELAALEPFGAP